VAPVNVNLTHDDTTYMYLLGTWNLDNHDLVLNIDDRNTKQLTTSLCHLYSAVYSKIAASLSLSR